MASCMQSLPNELITDITARVASSSLSSLFNLKQTCTALHELAEDNFVYRNVCMETIPVIPWHSTGIDATLFLQRCELSGNPEAIFRLGMLHYFQNVELQLGRSLLARAASLGHQVAMYVLGIVLLVCADTEAKAVGITLLNGVRNHVVECRIKCRMVLGSMWKKNVICEQESLCSDVMCKERNGRKIAQAWGGDNVEINFDCDGCRWDHEVTIFRRMLGAH